MIQLTREQITEVANEFDAGFKCFYNIETKEIKSVIDKDKYDTIDDLFQKDLDEIEFNFYKYVEIDAPDPYYLFEMMEFFIDTIENNVIHDKLMHAIKLSNPFGNFKNEIEKLDEYSHKWCDYKRSMLEEWVKEQVDYFNRTEKC